jgi:N-acetyl-anhydromuramyl-L-alanine amidase AmpD
VNLVPIEWMPQCSMKRVIVHWTAGAHRASDLDRAHYHLLVESDGTLVRGTHSIAANEHMREPRASHTRNCNTGSIGVAVCCMAGARERPFDAGQVAMTRRQWDVMADVVAELCRRYAIPVTARAVLGHGEVQANLNFPQLGKWDPLVLPWATGLSRAEVMDGFRTRVREHVAQLEAVSAAVVPASGITGAEGAAAQPA